MHTAYSFYQSYSARVCRRIYRNYTIVYIVCIYRFNNKGKGKVSPLQACVV